MIYALLHAKENNLGGRGQDRSKQAKWLKIGSFFSTFSSKIYPYSRACIIVVIF